MKTTKELVLKLTGMTVGFALMLADIELFRPVGLAIVVLTELLSATEEQVTKRVGSILLFLGACMFMVVLSICSGDTLAPRKPGPVHTVYVTALLVTWLLGGLWEFRRWKRSRAGDRAA